MSEEVRAMHQEYLIRHDSSDSSDPETDLLFIQGFTYRTTFNKSKYYTSNAPMNWYEARDACDNAGGHLIVINNEEENQLAVEVLSLIEADAGSAWIGLSDQDEEGNFGWESGIISNYTNWAAGEPNNEAYPGCHEQGDTTFCDEDFVHIHNASHPEPGSWNDAPGSMEYYAILEMEGNVDILP